MKRLASLQEEQAEDYKGALETIAKLLHDDITDETTWSELERLARVASAERASLKSTRWNSRGSPTTKRAPPSSRDAPGSLFAKLGNTDQALHFLRSAHQFEPESSELFAAIDALLVQTIALPSALRCTARPLDYREQAEERIATLHTIAQLERDALADPDRAIDTYRAVLEVDETDRRAQDQLTVLYRERGRFTDLAELYERRAAQATDAAGEASFRLLLARLLNSELKIPRPRSINTRSSSGHLPATKARFTISSLSCRSRSTRPG